MDFTELGRCLEDLNEMKRQMQEDRIGPELDRLNEYLRPYNLCVMLVPSPYSEKYPVVYAVLSSKAEEE